MGANINCRCPGCGYSADVTGCQSSGYHILVVTVSCQTCHTLSNAVVRRYRAEEAAAENYTAAVEEYGAEACSGRIPPRCRYAAPGEEHVVSIWTAPGPCPRCGDTIPAGMATCLWD